MFVICTLPNASDLINGVAFEDHPKGKVSVQSVSDDVAEAFAAIEGYKVVKDKSAKASAKEESGDKDPAGTADAGAAPKK